MWTASAIVSLREVSSGPLLWRPSGQHRSQVASPTRRYLHCAKPDGSSRLAPTGRRRHGTSVPVRRPLWFGGDQTGNDECGDAVGVQVRRRTCSRRIGHFKEDEVPRRFIRQFLLDDLAPCRGPEAGPCCAKAARCRSRRGQQRDERSAIEVSPGQTAACHVTSPS